MCINRSLRLPFVFYSRDIDLSLCPTRWHIPTNANFQRHYVTWVVLLTLAWRDSGAPRAPPNPSIEIYPFGFSYSFFIFFFFFMIIILLVLSSSSSSDFYSMHMSLSFFSINSFNLYYVLYRPFLFILFFLYTHVRFFLLYFFFFLYKESDEADVWFMYCYV